MKTISQFRLKNISIPFFFSIIILLSCNNTRKDESLIEKLFEELKLDCKVSIKKEDDIRTCFLDFRDNPNVLSKDYIKILSSYLKARFNNINNFKFFKEGNYLEHDYKIDAIKINSKRYRIYEYCLNNFKSLDFYTFNTAIERANKNLPQYASEEDFYDVIDDFTLDLDKKKRVSSSKISLALIFIFYKDSEDEDLKRLSRHVENIWKIKFNNPSLDVDKEIVLLFKGLH